MTNGETLRGFGGPGRARRGEAERIGSFGGGSVVRCHRHILGLFFLDSGEKRTMLADQASSILKTVLIVYVSKPQISSLYLDEVAKTILGLRFGSFLPCFLPCLLTLRLQPSMSRSRLF